MSRWESLKSAIGGLINDAKCELIAVDNGWSSEMFSSAAAYIWNTATFTNSRVLWMLPSDELQFWEARRHRVAKSGRQWIMIKLSSCWIFHPLPVFIHSTFLAWYCPEPFNFEVRNFRKTRNCEMFVKSYSFVERISARQTDLFSSLLAFLRGKRYKLLCV